MTNPEQPSPERPAQLPSSADAFIDYCAQAAPTRRLARTIRQLYEEHGAAFAAYLSLEDVNTASEFLSDDFDNTYIGSYLDEDTFIENQLTSLGWAQAIDRVIRTECIPEGVVTWDHDVLLEQMRRYMYDFIDLDGYLHVFSK